MGALPKGRESDLSAWQRSADEEAAPTATKMPSIATGNGLHPKGTSPRASHLGATSRESAPRNDSGKIELLDKLKFDISSVLIIIKEKE